MFNSYRLRLFGFAVLLAVVGAHAGCGTDMTVTEVDLYVDPPPTDVRSAGRLSGAGYATGGEHYITMQTLGSNFSSTGQSSADGTYNIR